ncbi:MAG: cell division protein ZapA [Candidatus Babeliales bacterium]|jgi:cell division protein ZapA (FtsZ GTPase activity inhibitor)
MDRQKKLKISILGKSYLINTDETQEDVFAAAHLVDSMLKESATKGSVTDDNKMAVIVALQLATELNKALNKLNGFESKIEQLNDLFQTEVR